MRPLPASRLLALMAVALSPSTHLVSAFDCHPTLPATSSRAAQSFDLTPLDGLRTTSKETDTPPTTSRAVVRMRLCGDEGVGREDGLADEDQCPPDTRVCLTLSNSKASSSEPERVTAVIPIWPAKLEPFAERTLSCHDGKGIEIFVEGGDYAGSQQNMSLKLLCAPDATDDSPTFVSYGNNLLSMTWKTPAGCPRAEGDNDNERESDRTENGGSVEQRRGRGFFGVLGLLFWLMVLGLGAYFAVGIYYNYTTYGARGKDLLPHRDFWLELPTMLGDLFSHLLAGLRGRHAGGGGGGGGSGGNRGGYTAI